MHNSLYAFDNCGKNSSHIMVQYNYSKEMFTGRAKLIRITSIRISGFLLYLEAVLGFDKTEKHEKKEEKLTCR